MQSVKRFGSTQSMSVLILVQTVCKGYQQERDNVNSLDKYQTGHYIIKLFMKRVLSGLIRIHTDWLYGAFIQTLTYVVHLISNHRPCQEQVVNLFS